MAGDLKLWLSLIYLVIALSVWINFMRLLPDGLASLGLWLTVLPIMLLDLTLRASDSPGASIFLPDRVSAMAGKQTS